MHNIYTVPCMEHGTIFLKEKYMKKCIFIFVFIALVSVGAFAQFALEGGLLNWTSPIIGFRYELPKLDIMGGMDFYLHRTKYEYDSASNPDFSYWYHNIGIYAGVAPKTSLSSNVSLSFPLLLQISFGGTSEYDLPGTQTVTPWAAGSGDSTFGFKFITGARASYKFTEHWSLFSGFFIDVFSYSSSESNVWKGPTVADGTKASGNITSDVYLLSSGSIQVGVSYLFK